MTRTKLFPLLLALFLLLLSGAALLAAQRAPTVIILDGSPKYMARPAPVMEDPQGGSPTSQAVCEESGGKWNACGSACRTNPQAVCVQLCVAYCECASDDQCPSSLRCKDIVKGTGVCRAASK